MPPSAATAGQHQVIAADGQPDLIGVRLAVWNRGAEDVFQYGCRQSRGVGVDEKERGFVGEKLHGAFDERVEGFLDLPQLAVGAATVARGIHQYPVIAVATAQFALDELDTVIHDIANGRVTETAGGHIVLGPGNHALGGIHMAYGRAAFETGAGRAARVGEKIEYTTGAVRLDFLLHKGTHPIPVDGLLGEKAGVLKAGWPHDKRQVAIADRP